MPGGHAQLGVDLAHDFQAGLRAGGRVHATHDVGSGHFAGVHLLAGNGQVGRAVGLAALDQDDAHGAVGVINGGVILLGGQRLLAVFHHQSAQEHARLLHNGHSAVDLHGLLLHLGGVLGRVQHIDQHQGGHVHHRERSGDRFAEGETRKVVAVPNGSDSFRLAVYQQRLIDGRSRVRQQVHRGSPDHDLQTGCSVQRSDHAGFLLADVNAMSIHTFFPPSYNSDLIFWNRIASAVPLRPRLLLT